MLKNVPVWTFLTLPVYVPVAQLDRASDSDSEGRAFESHQAYHVGTSYACSDSFDVEKQKWVCYTVL